ncbi:MAG: TolC family protein [Clostridiales bacterium]|nr:TolC family protein [Clostridiales bacterium]
MKYGRRGAAALMLAAVTGVMAPFSAWAGSPEFAYSAEKWATLRDDNLDYDEIADLIHEYNNTVQQNYLTYMDELDEDRDDTAQDYYDAANDIYNNITWPDSDDSNYGSGVASALQSEQQADELMKQGDEAVDDTETKKLGYDKTEAELVKQAQELMITYWSQYYSLESLEDSIEQARISYQTEQNKLAAGTSTQSAVLTAKNTISTAEASLLTTQSSIGTTKDSLLLMLGWTYGADVVIGELPEPDLEAINAIDVTADIETALTTNYTYLQTTKQLANARSSTVKEKLTQTVKNQKEAISTDVKDKYESLILALSNYEQAQLSLELADTAVNTAAVQLAAGTITQKTYDSKLSSQLSAQSTVTSRKLALLTAMVEYDWAVNGLASTS